MSDGPILLIFIDGFWVGPNDARINPFLSAVRPP